MALCGVCWHSRCVLASRLLQYLECMLYVSESMLASSSPLFSLPLHPELPQLTGFVLHSFSSRPCYSGCAAPSLWSSTQSFLLPSLGLLLLHLLPLPPLPGLSLALSYSPPPLQSAVRVQFTSFSLCFLLWTLPDTSGCLSLISAIKTFPSITP